MVRDKRDLVPSKGASSKEVKKAVGRRGQFTPGTTAASPKVTNSSVTMSNACGIIIGADVKALQCDRCCSAESWKCIDCLNITGDIYDSLLSESGCELKWFCNKCDGNASTPTVTSGLEGKVEEILDVLGKLLHKTNNIESALNDKADQAEVDNLAARISTLEGKLDMRCMGTNDLDNTTCALNELREARLCELEERMMKHEQDLHTKLSEIEDMKSKFSPQTVTEPVSREPTEAKIQQAVQAELNRKIGVDKELENRKKNIVVFRVPEKRSDNFTERKEYDLEFIKDLMDIVFRIKLKESDIDRMYRLGRWSADAQADRPILVSFRDVELKQLFHG